MRKLAPLSSFSTRAWSLSQSAFCHSFQAHFWVYLLCNPSLSTWRALATCQRPCLAMALCPSVLPSHIYSTRMFQPGLQKRHLAWLWICEEDCGLLLLLSKTFWTMSASLVLQVYMFLALFTTYSRNIGITSITVPLPHNGCWNFPWFFTSVTFFPGMALGREPWLQEAAPGPSLCRDLRYWLYFVFNCQHPFLFEKDSVEICYVFLCVPRSMLAC